MRAILATGTGIAAIMLAIGWGHAGAQEAAHGQGTQPTVSGEELFLREWLPNDPRSPAGDGLGPVFNDTSCVACHNLGGTGGGGPSAKNVELLVLGRVADEEALTAERSGSIFEQFLESLRRFGKKKIANIISPAEREKMARIHPGFRDGNSLVLHRFGTDPRYSSWRGEQRLGETAVELEKARSGPFEQVPASSPSNAENSDADDSPPPFDDSPHGRMRSAVMDFIRDGYRKSIDDPWLVVRGRTLLWMAEKVLDLGRQVVTALSSPPGDELSLFSSLRDSIPSNGIVRRILVEKQLGMIGNISPFMGPEDETENPTILRLRSQRNPTALFGVGRIDSISDEVIEAAARNPHPGFMHVTGRVSRLKNGRIGRFGWKGQTATLRDFTMTACAVELGLHVPEHPQAPSPTQPEQTPAGFDLSGEECDALVEFLRGLPAPKQSISTNPAVADYIAIGRKLFEKTGCAECHVARLGDVDGIYSDLLLHDLGTDLSDQGFYGAHIDELRDELEATESRGSAGALEAKRSFRAHADRPADSTEWRTPPLWGVGQSAPYLHDGRANTLEEAILHHGGEAAQSTIAYYSLEPLDRMKVIAFLKTLGVPE